MHEMPDHSAQQAQPETVALFISDLHLQEAMQRTTQAFVDFIERRACNTQQLYLLGDVFEAWAGDDDIDDAYNRRIVTLLKQLSNRGVALYWMAGNRDFLAGERFAEETGAVLLPDPYVTTISGNKLTLTHGDAYCTDDESYMQFRAQVRNPAWQHAFLAMPLEQRKTIIESLRAGSREAQRGKTYDIMDVNAAAIAELFASTQTSTIIHGHTHRPARHHYTQAAGSAQRYVLSDWDLDQGMPRGDWLAIDAVGAIRRYGLDGVEIAD
jgi:UDP-2,3-diacylglucosamine hydrolase